jgi:hypothetical protein
MAALALTVSGACFGEVEYTPERYDVILDRSPFGADPLLGAIIDNSAQEKADAAAAAALAKDLRLCFVLESQDGEVRAGLQNQKDKKSFILSIGESIQGVKLLGVDIENSEARLERNGQTVLFKLDKDPVVSKTAPQPQAADPRKFGSGFRRTPPPAEPPKPPEPELTPEEQLQRRDEIRANLQNYQMEVIRSGMPPLPIPLTKEMDDQLVAEGILPPE